MLNVYVRVINRLAGLRAASGEVGVEYVILVAVLGAAVLAGATVFRGSIEAAFNRLATSVNGVG